MSSREPTPTTTHTHAYYVIVLPTRQQVDNTADETAKQIPHCAVNAKEENNIAAEFPRV